MDDENKTDHFINGGRVLAFGVGFAGVTVAAVAAETISSLFSKDDITERDEPVIEQAKPEPPAAIVTEPVGAEIETEKDNEPVLDEYYAAGSFYLGGAETVPKEFSDIDYVEIITHDYEKTREDDSPGVPIPPKGRIVTKKQHDFVRIAIIGKEISFQTETVDGVSYRFTGQYHHVNYCETDGDTPDLIGQLIKIKDGKWAASMKAEFYVQCGC
jgi:hypothetical protein